MSAIAPPTPTAADVAELCQAFNVENKNPDALLWLVVTALAIWGPPQDREVRTLRSLLNPSYEPGDGSADGAQLVDGQWWHPAFGCDSLQYVVDNARQALAPEAPDATP